MLIYSIEYCTLQPWLFNNFSRHMLLVSYFIHEFKAYKIYNWRQGFEHRLPPYTQKLSKYWSKKFHMTEEKIVYSPYIICPSIWILNTKLGRIFSVLRIWKINPYPSCKYRRFGNKSVPFITIFNFTRHLSRICTRKPLILFLFLWAGFHWLSFKLCVVFTKMFAGKNGTLEVILKWKKKETTWCLGWALRVPLRP